MGLTGIELETDLFIRVGRGVCILVDGQHPCLMNGCNPMRTRRCRDVDSTSQ